MRTPQELANDIVRRIYLGAHTGGEEGRHWDPAKHPSLLRHLKWIAMSDLSGKGLLGRKRDKDLEYVESESELDILAGGCDPPENDDSEKDPFSEALKREIAGDTDLEDVVAAIELGFSKSGDIARETGIAPDKIYELRRKLRRKALLARQALEMAEVRE